MRTDAVALALIEARLATAREQQLVAQIRQARREARREQRAQAHDATLVGRTPTPADQASPRHPARGARSGRRGRDRPPGPAGRRRWRRARRRASRAARPVPREAGAHDPDGERQADRRCATVDPRALAHVSRAPVGRMAAPMTAPSALETQPFDVGATMGATSAVPAGLSIQLLGRPGLEIDGASGYRFRSRKSWAVLAFLLLSERPPTRTQLASLLFAEADDPMRALRWCLAEIRRGLGPAASSTATPWMLTLPAGTTVDVDVLVHGHWRDAVALPGLGARPPGRDRDRPCRGRSRPGCCPSDAGSRRRRSRSCTRRPSGSSRAASSTGRATSPYGPP